MYRGEIQNDSNGGNYNRSLDYTPSIGGLGYGGRRETRNFAVGAPLRGAGIGRCEEDEYNCCGLYGRGENEEMEDDPCWDGYEMIGTKMKKGREVPNCVPVGEGKPFTNKQLTKIILDKNKVIADLEENAYGGGGLRPNEGIGDMFERMRQENKDAERKRDEEDARSRAKFADFDGWWKSMGGADFKWTDLEKAIEEHNRKNQAVFFDAKGEGFWDDVKKGLVKHNERKKSTPISEEDWKKQMEDFKAPTENWGADELDGGMNVEQKLKEQLEERKKRASASAAQSAASAAAESQADRDMEKLQREMEISRLQRELRELNERRQVIRQESEGIRERATTPPRAPRGQGGAAPKAEPKAPSGVAAAAEVLKPVREAVQKGIGDLIYGKEDDPKKQKKGLLGISEEGKEESKKKVMKNIVVPVAKAMNELKTNIEDTWNQSFNKDKYDADMKERRIKQIKKEEAEAGIVRDKENPMIIIRKPRGMWKADTTDPTVEAYNRKRTLRWNRGAKTQEETEKEVYYIRVPNPIFAAKLKPSFKEFSDAGVKLWTGVEQLKKGESEDVDGTLKQLQDDPFIFIPEDRAKEIYGQLRQFVADKQDEGVMEGYEDEGWTKGQLKAFAKIDPRTLKGQELIDWKESKLVLDKVTTQNALEKVTKDIAEEEKGKTVIRGERPVRIEPDKARLAKMREAKVRVENRLKELSLRGQQEFKDMMMFQNAEKAKRDAEYDARLKADAQGAINEADADKAEFDAKPVAERIAILESYKEDSEGQTLFDLDEQIEQLRAQEKSDAAESFKTLSPAERSIQLDAYRKDLQEQGFTDEQIEEQIGAVGGGKGDEDEEEVDIIEVILSKMERYFVDAPPKNEKGERVGLPLGPYKKAISGPLGIGNRRVYDTETEEELGLLKDPEWKKLAMKVLKMEKGWRDENLKKLGYDMEDSDADSVASESSRGGGAKPVEMKQGDYYKEHQNIVKLLKNTGKSLLSEANDQQGEATAMAKKMGAPDPFDDDELVGEGAIEWTLAKAGKSLFNPTGDMTKAGIQTFTPDYDAYGATVEQGRLNAFNLSRSMYNQQQAIELPDFDLIEDDISLRFYLKDDEDVIMVGIRGTDVKSWTDLYTWAVIGAKQDFRMTTRFQDDLQKLMVFQKQYPMTQYYYVGVGSSLAGSIADRFLDMGLIDEAITYNPSIEKKYILDADIHNHRVYLDTDPLFILMGQYAPNVEIRKNASRADFYNPSKEKDYLIASHSIFPVYNPAFEGGGMMGAGKTYTIEEWKAIFDAKLEQKRQQIEAREAKKKQTAKAKRERAKAVRDGRDEPPPLETPATFRTSRVMKATPPREPEPAPPAPKKRKPRFKIVAPASARVELRQELVAEQPRKPEGEFAQEAEPLQLVVAEIERQPQRAYMRLMKSPMLTDADRQLMMNLQSSKMAPMRKVKLLARSGLARKLMEILGIDESAFQSQRARARIADTMEKRTTAAKVREIVLPEDIEALFKRQEEGLISYVAEYLTRKTKDLGRQVSSFLDYPEEFARCGFGCLGLVAKCMSADPLDTYYGGSGVLLKPLYEKRKLTSRLALVAEVTQAEESHLTLTKYWSTATRENTTMNFGRTGTARFILPELTNTCLGRLTEIDGIREVFDTTRSAGMGYKRRNEWQVIFTDKDGLKRWSASENEELVAKIKTEIVPKVEKMAEDLKEPMLRRAKLMKERLDASLTDFQKKAVAEYKKR